MHECVSPLVKGAGRIVLTAKVAEDRKKFSLARPGGLYQKSYIFVKSIEIKSVINAQTRKYQS